MIEFEPVTLRYDGRGADDHEIDANALGVSLQGFARILAVSGHFCQTGTYAKQWDSLSVNVVVRPAEPHCFEMIAFLRSFASEPFFAGAGTGLLVAVVTYVLNAAAGRKEEMKHLRSALGDAIKELGSTNERQTEQLLGVIERLATGLKPAVKQAVEPVGKSCSIASVVVGKCEPVQFTEDDKADILGEVPEEIGPERTYLVRLVDVDIESGRCRLRLDDDSPVRGEISDPQLRGRGDPYTSAMNQRRPLRVRAKPAISEDGEIQRLYISDIDTDPS